MPAPPLSRVKVDETIAALKAAIDRGYPMTSNGGGSGGHAALSIARQALGIDAATMRNRIASIRKHHPDLIDALPDAPNGDRRKAFAVMGPEPDRVDADALIETLKARSAKRAAQAVDIIPVDIREDGPIAIAFIGDPHVDDPGCAWHDLERDVNAIADAEACFAIAVGDYRNNWIGRLTALYADQNVTRKEALALIEWLFARLSHKLIAGVRGNHDEWHTLGGDPLELLARLTKLTGFYGDPSYRFALKLPGGAEARVHVRHDFPGRSQFNPAHALVRETLFGYRDHILACGDRHHSGYMPIWHNDPPRLCQGIRVGTYKDFDEYARVKGFRFENWSRAMVAIIDPRCAHDPVEFVTVRFSVEAGLRELRARRAEWKASIPAPRAPPKRALRAR